MSLKKCKALVVKWAITPTGILSGLTDVVQQHPFSKDCRLNLQFNFDGLPLFKSSSMELWPILCLITNISCTPFVVGLYCGSKSHLSF